MIKSILLSLFCLIGSSLIAQDITSNLILDMSFSDEVTDLTENSIPQPSGMETFAEDRDGNPACAVNFTGAVDEYIRIPVNAENALVQGDAITVSLWFKMNNIFAGNLELLFMKGETTNSGFEMAVYDVNTPVIGDSSFGLGIWDEDWNSDQDLWTDTENWHHFVMVLTNTNVKLYRDNEVRNSFDYTGDEFDITALELDYKIGQGFIGYLDDIKVYKRALSADEISALYNLNGSCATLSIGDKDLVNITISQPQEKVIQINNLPPDNSVVNIYNVLGERVLKIPEVNSGNKRLNVSTLSSGLYLIHLENGTSKSTHKFILK